MGKQVSGSLSLTSAGIGFGVGFGGFLGAMGDALLTGAGLGITIGVLIAWIYKRSRRSGAQRSSADNGGASGRC